MWLDRRKAKPEHFVVTHFEGTVRHTGTVWSTTGSIADMAQSTSNWLWYIKNTHNRNLTINFYTSMDHEHGSSMALIGGGVLLADTEDWATLAPTGMRWGRYLGISGEYSIAPASGSLIVRLAGQRWTVK